MNWRTGLPGKKTDLRLIVACPDGRNKTYKYDVGYRELVELYNANKGINVIDLGKFADDRELGNSTEAEQIKHFIDEKGIKKGRC